MSNKEYRPTLSQLRTFVTIAENRHFGTAAAKLGISQPSLSQALSALETGLCMQLIERSTRKVIVTSTGQDLLPYAKATLDAADAFLARSRGAHGPLHGALTIGVIPTVAPYILPYLLGLMQETYPDLEPRIIEDQTARLLHMLREGTLDVAIIATPAEAVGISERTLYHEKFVVVVPEGHPYAGRNDLKLDALNELDLLLLEDGHCLHDQIIDLCRKAEINPTEATTAITRASSLTTIMQLVVAGMGSTLAPLSAVGPECHRDGVATARFAPEITAERHIGLAFRQSTSREEEFELLGELVKKAYAQAVEAFGEEAVLED